MLDDGAVDAPGRGSERSGRPEDLMAVVDSAPEAVPAARRTGVDARAGHQCGAQRECRGEEAEKDAVAGGSGHLRTVALPVAAGKPHLGALLSALA